MTVARLALLLTLLLAASAAGAALPDNRTVAPAKCAKGSRPETGVQGRVPRGERDSGRSAKGYTCNLKRIGRYQGEGASWVSQSYGHCAYMATRYPSMERTPGVPVLDVSDPAHPKRTTTLSSPAMLGTWETLKVNQARGLLAAVSAFNPNGQGVAFFDVYDIRTDCAHPRLLNAGTLPSNTLGHEGGWSPDGRTYWSANAYSSVLSAIDVADPAHPQLIFTGVTGRGNHGFGISADGNRLYMAEAGRLGSGALLAPSFPDNAALPNGLQVFDVSEVQKRVTDPQIHQIGQLLWDDGAAGQHAIPITLRGHPYLIFVDELLNGSARIIDIADETQPKTVSRLRLAIQTPKYADQRRADTPDRPLFGYDGHYCAVDSQTDPKAVACGYFQSGVRVFDIHRPRHPKEIAYYNPPAQVGKDADDLPGSEHAATAPDMTTDWCSSPPRFVGRQLWVTCQDNGFMVLKFFKHLSI